MAMRDVVFFAVCGDGAAVGSAARCQVAFADDEAAQAVAKVGGGFDGDAAAHAVAVQVEVVQAEVVNEFEDGAGMGRGCVGKVARAFAVAAASEVKQDGAAASKLLLGAQPRFAVDAPP